MNIPAVPFQNISSTNPELFSRLVFVGYVNGMPVFDVFKTETPSEFNFLKEFYGTDSPEAKEYFKQ